MNQLKKLMPTLLVVLATACAHQSHAQTANAENTPWYQIEVVIFSQQDLYREEKHRTDHQLSYPDHWVNLYDPAKLQNSAIINSEQPYTPLPTDLLTLIPDSRALSRAPGYRVLYHTAWRQEGLDQKKSPWILVQGGDQFGSHHELEGSLRLVKNRYLHIQANLWKAKFALSRSTPEMDGRQIEGTESSNTFKDGTQPPETIAMQPILPEFPRSTELEEDEAFVVTGEEESRARVPEKQEYQFGGQQYKTTDVIVLEQSARVSRDELTYLDHPEMGVLVMVSKYENNEEGLRP